MKSPPPPSGAAWRGAFDQYWKLPADPGFCPTIEAKGAGRALERLTADGVTFFSPSQWTSAPPALEPRLAVNDAAGRPVSALGVTRAGELYLPFELQEVIETFQRERYVQTAPEAGLLRLARQLYYRARPLIPRALQIAFRQSISSLQSARDFPAWPIDYSLDDFVGLMMQQLLQASGLAQLPFVWFWPRPYTSAVVLTHDVEQQVGHDHVRRITALEEHYGLRSLWNFVPRRYRVDPALLTDLAAAGFEIGVHGLYHDGHLFDSREAFASRVDAINEYLTAWHSQGFRAPSAIRNLEWIAELLHTAYDTSCPTAEIHGPQPGGCCTVLPYQVNSLVELPFSLPQDHTLFTILRAQSADVWLQVARAIQARHGLINVIVHPDYMLEDTALAHYETLLRWITEQSNLWVTLPREAAAWWRRRSQLKLSNPPAAEITGPQADQAGVGYVRLEDSQLRLAGPAEGRPHHRT